MQVPLIDIGTSRGIRIPSVILKEFNNLDSFDLKIQSNRIILDVIKNPRDGWAEKFKKPNNDLLIDDALDVEDWNAL